MTHIVQFAVDINATEVTATNLVSGKVRKFSIKSTVCEVNGDRDYLVEEETRLRVRLFTRSEDDINKAVVDWVERFFDGVLYKHPE